MPTTITLQERLILLICFCNRVISISNPPLPLIKRGRTTFQSNPTNLPVFCAASVLPHPVLTLKMTCIENIFFKKTLVYNFFFIEIWKKRYETKLYKVEPVAFLLRPTVPTKVWTGANTPTLSFLEVGSI
jgi:hypothetical protein